MVPESNQSIVPHEDPVETHSNDFTEEQNGISNRKWIRYHPVLWRKNHKKSGGYSNREINRIIQVNIQGYP